MTSDLVLVTGASGYIATHLIQQLQQTGHRVRGTVRSLKNEDKVKPLRKLCPDAKYPLELVEADLLDAESWENVVKDCTFVMHVASPFPFTNPQNENDVIKPAVDGTLNVLRACNQAKTVRRVVLTSSSVAVSSGAVKQDKPFTEKDWTDTTISDITTYRKSKTLAERAAWDFVNGLKHADKFELVVVNPVMVMGPVISGPIASSLIYPKKILEEEQPFLPDVYLPIIDVRDVATAHIKAMEVPQAAGNRHLLRAGYLWYQDIANIIAEEFNPKGYKVKVREIPAVGTGPNFNVDNSRMTSVLGIQARNVKDTILEMCYSMIDNGQIKKAE